MLQHDPQKLEGNFSITHPNHLLSGQKANNEYTTMKNPKTALYNVAHPLAESGKPIFIPFGEWNYDGQSRQRLDRAHGEKIANELNARVAKGEPGIPVYQGHPDVPALASKYPDKGALGWVVRAELANEDGKEGLALTVEWDRDPGRGFRWFSPYWLANSREGGTYIVDEIASIGLVNNPNIPEFRLANEEQPMKKKLNPAIIELAAKYDRLANEANFDESKHPRADDGKFTSGGGGGGAASGKSPSPELKAKADAARAKAGTISPSAREWASDKIFLGAKDITHEGLAKRINSAKAENHASREDKSVRVERLRALHAKAISLGFRYNTATGNYE